MNVALASGPRATAARASKAKTYLVISSWLSTTIVPVALSTVTASILRIYSVDRYGAVTWERPEVRVTTAEPPDVLGSSLNWPLCECQRATGRPCPEQKA